MRTQCGHLHTFNYTQKGTARLKRETWFEVVESLKRTKAIGHLLMRSWKFECTVLDSNPFQCFHRKFSRISGRKPTEDVAEGCTTAIRTRRAASRRKSSATRRPPGSPRTDRTSRSTVMRWFKRLNSGAVSSRRVVKLEGEKIAELVLNTLPLLL